MKTRHLEPIEPISVIFWGIRQEREREIPLQELMKPIVRVLQDRILKADARANNKSRELNRQIQVGCWTNLKLGNHGEPFQKTCVPCGSMQLATGSHPRCHMPGLSSDKSHAIFGFFGQGQILRLSQPCCFAGQPPENARPSKSLTLLDHQATKRQGFLAAF